MVLCNLHQAINPLLRQSNGKNAVLERIASENVGETGGNHHAQAHVEQSPCGMFPAGTAAKIIARNQDLRIGILWLVENVIGIFAKPFKSALAKPLTRNCFEPLGSDNHIGVDVFRAKGNGPAVNIAQFVHQSVSGFSLVGPEVGEVGVPACFFLRLLA